ncbi:MAG: hypothetical protein ACRDQF_11355, partial [Thermocrispum sp.]
MGQRIDIECVDVLGGLCELANVERRSSKARTSSARGSTIAICAVGITITGDVRRELPSSAGMSRDSPAFAARKRSSLAIPPLAQGRP